MTQAIHSRDEQAATVFAPLFARGKVIRVDRLPGGNINDTYLVCFQRGGGVEPFILQRLNGHVFRDPQAVMCNLRVLGDHIVAVLAAERREQTAWYVPAIITSLDGRDFVPDGDGCWRGLTQVPHAVARDRVHDIEHARQVGVAVGRYQQLLCGLPTTRLADTLAGFHVTPGYLAQLDRVLASTEARKRVAATADGEEMLRFIDRRRPLAGRLQAAEAAGELMSRPVHGDPKVANVMVHLGDGRAVAMIDLDTSKPGLVQYDFGDCVRSTCNPAGEETADPSDASLDLDLFDAVVSGYYRHGRNFLTDGDYAYLYESVWTLSYELSVRFFCDHADGNRYFRVTHPLHNLHRALVQRRLCESIEEQEVAMRAVLARRR